MNSTNSVRTFAEFPEIPVRAVIPADGVRLGDLLGTGPLMMAMVDVAASQGTVIGVRVFAYASEIALLDLPTLRHRGRQTVVTEWAPVPDGMLRIGATLRAVLQDGPETVEVTDYGPIFRTAA